MLATTSAVMLFGAVSGCGLRWERDAPQLPVVPSARPYPGGAALRTELAHCSAARTAAQRWSGVGGPVLSRVIVRVHDEQIAALTARLEAASEPTRATESTSGPATSPTPGRTVPPEGEEEAARRRLLAAESAGLTDYGLLVAAAAADRPLLAGCLVARGQAARLLGARALPRPHRPAAGSVAQAVELLATVRPVVYGLEVAAARVVVARGERAPMAQASLEAARRQRQLLEQQAGSRAPAPPPGYRLDAPVATPADAERLARRLLTALADAHVRALGVADPAQAAQDGPTREPGSPDPVSERVVASLLGWAREAEWWRGAWGLGPRALGIG